MSRRLVFISCVLPIAAVIAPIAFSGAKEQISTTAPKADSIVRFEFDVVESFDARYSGDTPGHVGRHGGLQEMQPMVALGDAVYRGEAAVGHVTRLEWSRVHGSLGVEFSPSKDSRVCVGDNVWLKFGGSK